MNQLRKKLFGALIGLSRASESKEILESSGIALSRGLVLAFDQYWEQIGTDDEVSTVLQESVSEMIQILHEEKALMAPDCAACQYPCGRTADYDMDETLEASESLRDAKLKLLMLLGKLAALTESDSNPDIQQFISDALFQISCTYEAGQLSVHIEKATELASQR